MPPDSTPLLCLEPWISPLHHAFEKVRPGTIFSGLHLVLIALWQWCSTFYSLCQRMLQGSLPIYPMVGIFIQASALPEFLHGLCPFKRLEGLGFQDVRPTVIFQALQPSLAESSILPPMSAGRAPLDPEPVYISPQHVFVIRGSHAACPTLA